MRRELPGEIYDIREAASFIIDDTADMSFESFMGKRLIWQAVERNFEIIGEATNRLKRHDPDILTRISVPHRIIALRNALAHGYYAVDYSAVWDAIQMSLPVLMREVEALIAEQG